jgi:transcriptional regulator with XRE-family HTH domain
MGKKSNQQRVLQFRRDITLLKKRYTQNVIADRVGIDSGNLSSYSRGRKNPGEDFLDKFYSIFAAEILESADIFDTSDQQPLLTVDEPPQEFNRPDDRDDHIRTLKLNNEDLRRYLDSLVKSNEALVINNQKLTDAQLLLISRLNRAEDRPAGE